MIAAEMAFVIFVAILIFLTIPRVLALGILRLGLGWLLVLLIFLVVLLSLDLLLSVFLLVALLLTLGLLFLLLGLGLFLLLLRLRLLLLYRLGLLLLSLRLGCFLFFRFGFFLLLRLRCFLMPCWLCALLGVLFLRERRNSRGEKQKHGRGADGSQYFHACFLRCYLTEEQM